MNRYKLTMRHVLAGLIATLVLLTAGCADSRRGDVYTRDEARQAMQVRYGWIESVRPVQIEGERGFLGQAGGGVVGGVAGSSVGGGKGQIIGATVGAVAGAVAGGAAQERMTRADGAEITVRLDGGEVMAVVQEVSHPGEFVPGQRVRVTRAQDGSARVAPLGSR